MTDNVEFLSSLFTDVIDTGAEEVDVMNRENNVCLERSVMYCVPVPGECLIIVRRTLCIYL